MGEPSPSNEASNVASASPTSGPQADPLIGRVINERFKVLSLIARGGMGKVYKAEQAPLGRICALKVLNPNYNGDHDPEFHKRFFLEASTSSKLRHPNTVTIFDYGNTDDGVYYMAMELLEGRTLHRMLRESGPVEPSRALRIVRQVCRSLREAHTLGVIHRDLKPANIFLVRTEDDEDFVKVLDFGLVKQLDEGGGDHLTQTGLFMGSPKYMAPEQIRGERVSAATDVYALGVVLFEMLTGKVPFDKGNSVNTLMAHVSEPVPAMQQINPSVSVPAAVQEFTYRCLAKRAEDRFATMDAVLDGIKLAATGSLGLSSTGEWAPSVTDARVTGSHLVSAEHLSAASGSGQVLAQPPSVAPSGPHEQSGVNSMLTPSVPMVAVSDQPASQKKKSMTLPAIGAIALLAIVGGAVALKGGSGSTHAQGTNGQSTADTRPAQNTAGTGAQNTATGTGPAANNTNTQQPQPPPAREVRIVLNSEPGNAEVFENGQSLGRTPLDLRLSGEQADPSRMHAFTFKLNGYNDAQVTLGGSEIRYSARMSRRVTVRPTPNTRPDPYRGW